MQAAAHFSIHRNGIYLPFIQAQMAVPSKPLQRTSGITKHKRRPFLPCIASTRLRSGDEWRLDCVL
jgi:hypothetical protein